jgi:hypothetical protein
MMERLIQKESDEYNPDDFAEIKERLGLVEFFEDDTVTMSLFSSFSFMKTFCKA